MSKIIYKTREFVIDQELTKLSSCTIVRLEFAAYDQQSDINKEAVDLIRYKSDWKNLESPWNYNTLLKEMTLTLKKSTMYFDMIHWKPIILMVSPKLKIVK